MSSDDLVFDGTVIQPDDIPRTSLSAPSSGDDLFDALWRDYHEACRTIGILTMNARLARRDLEIERLRAAGERPDRDPKDNTFDRLTAVRGDLGWRVGCAAREDDPEAIQVYGALCDAIDAALAFSELRRASAGAAPPDREE
jgi:hypothetical protein